MLEQITFPLKTDYIELYQLLKVTGVCSTGGAAKQLIVADEVFVDQQVENRKAKKIYAGQKVQTGTYLIDVVEFS